MIHDATVEVTCDECQASITIEPEYVYNDYSGRSGHYDTTDAAIGRKLEQEGWVVDGDNQYCDFCRSEEEEDDDDE